MLLLPYSSELRLAQIPYVTLAIILLCFAVYNAQESNRYATNKAITTFCEDINQQSANSNRNKFNYMPTNFRACVYFISLMHDLPDLENWIEYNVAIFDDQYSLNDLEKYAEYEYYHYEKFRITAPVSLDSQLMFAPYTQNIFSMITSAISHADWMHVIGNLIFFFAFAPALELLSGNRLKFFIFMILISISCGISYSIISIVNNSPVPTLGLSGVVMGMIGFSAYMMPYARIRTLVWFMFFIRIISIPAWILAVWYVGWDTYDLFSRTDTGGVNLIAHVAGGFSGYIFAILMFKEQRKKVREELSDEVDYMRSARQDHLGIMSSYKGRQHIVDQKMQEKLDKKIIGGKMDLLYRYVNTGNTSEAILLILTDYDINEYNQEYLYKFFEEIGKWKKGTVYLCVGRLLVHVLHDQGKYAQLLSILEECFKVKQNFLLADPATAIPLAKEAISNNQPELAYRIVKNSKERYIHYINVTDCLLLEANILWEYFSKANEAKSLILNAIESQLIVDIKKAKNLQDLIEYDISGPSSSLMSK